MLGTFREVVVVDTEFTAITGERPVPVCVVAHELRSGRRFRLFEGQFGPEPPYAAGADVLFVAFYASADLGVYRVLGWRMPERILDPFIEFRNRTNGLPTPAGSSLLGALAYFGLDAIAAVEKHEMQEVSAFRSRTGRNQPSNTRFIFGPSVWLRGLVKPPPCHAVAYVDWKQQEFGIAAALSGDMAMQAAYQSGDPYLAFAKQAHAVPHNATKATHGAQRELFKQCVLAVQYGMQADGLALRIAQPRIVARDLLLAHHQTYQTFWRWSDAALDTAMLTGSLHTVFGWHVHIDEKPNPRSLRNFPMQANGAEMLRLAACLAIERGIEVCAPVHDAFLICAPFERLDADVATMRATMVEASRVVLGGFELGTDVSVTKWPDRYMDSRGHIMWHRVTELLDRDDLRQTA
jgi:DNA polymerase family A